MTSTQFLADLTALKGADWVTMLNKLVELKRMVAAVPAEEEELVRFMRTKAFSEMLQTCRSFGYATQPATLNADAKTLEKLLAAESGGSEQT